MNFIIRALFVLAFCVTQANAQYLTTTGGSATPSGAAGGDLSGTYPNPTVAKILGVAPGTGVATALGVNIGSAGATVLFNGAGGTPSSLVGTNITGTATGLTAGTVTTNANLTGDVTSAGNATTLVTAQTGAHTWSAAQTISANGAASAPSTIFTGTLFTGGTATTTFPQMLFQPTGTTAVTSWSTSGTGLGMNLASGFAGNFLDFHVAGAASVFSVSSIGAVNASGNLVSGGSVAAGAAQNLGFLGRGQITSPAVDVVQIGNTNVTSGATGGTLTFQGNTASTTNGPLALIQGAGGGSSTSVGGELRLSGGLSSAAAGTGGAVTIYTAPAATGNAAALVATFAANKATTLAGTLTVSGITNVATTSALCYNTGTGLITYDGTLGTCTVSDERLKNMGERIPNALDRLLQINGVYYTWKDASLGSGRQIGVGAQTVEKVFPELVQTDINGRKSADYQRLTAPIIEAMRELKADNDNLRLDVNELKRAAR